MPDDGTARRRPRRDGSHRRRLLREREVRAIVVIVRSEAGQKTPEVHLVEDDDVVEKIAAGRRDESFGDAVGPSCRVHPMMTMRIVVFASRIGSIRCSDANSIS